MRKIELSSETEKKHLAYFKEQIIPILISSRSKPYPYTTTEIRLLKMEPSLFAKKFHKQHFHFVGFIKNKYEVFAVGRLAELEKLHLEIERNFPLITKMIRLNDPVFTENYKDYLNRLFGYEKFKVKDLYYYIKQRAQRNVGQQRYSERVFKEMVGILMANFPQRRKEIIDVLMKNGGSLTADKCKAAFRKLDGYDITMDNFRQHDIFGDEWNDYALVMESGLRVCPYCNRQYITPIYSDNGKMRADLDHFLPKSKYPYFSMSLYNLVPVCKSCNQSLKRDHEFSFKSISPYEDNISDYFRFKANVRTHEISIEIQASAPTIKQHIDTFKIESLYNYHRNQVKELISKRISYPDEYIQNLYKENKAYFNSVHEVKQLIIGFIDDKSRMNEEAFLKFRRDLAEQLGFLSDRNNDLKIARLKKIIGNRL